MTRNHYKLLYYIQYYLQGNHTPAQFDKLIEKFNPYA